MYIIINFFVFLCPWSFELWLLYISTSVLVLRTPNAGWNSHFQCFYAKKLKKQEIWSKFLQKTGFLSLHQNAGQLFYSQKNELFFAKNKFLHIKSCESLTIKKNIFWGIKQSTSVLVQALKNMFFCKNVRQISCFFAEKMLKMTISTSFWSVQHPNTGRNVQHLTFEKMPRDDWDNVLWFSKIYFSFYYIMKHEADKTLAALKL